MGQRRVALFSQGKTCDQWVFGLKPLSVGRVARGGASSLDGTCPLCRVLPCALLYVNVSRSVFLALHLITKVGVRI